MFTIIAKQWKKHSLITFILMFCWMALQASWSVSTAIVGICIGFFISIIAYTLAPLNIRVKKLSKVGRLFVCVLFDMIASNIQVCKCIWRRNPEALQPGFLDIPLSLRDPSGLAILACIITYTPGTVWTRLSDEYTLTIHVLDLVNKEEWIQFIKQRYEAPLREIFE